MNIGRLVRPEVRGLRAYEAREVPCKVKLDANESPYGFAALKGVMTNRYPDPESRELKKTLAGMLKVRASSILMGNGSDELIYYLITTFGGPVLFPTPTFVMYELIARALGQRAIGVPLEAEGFDMDLKAMMRAIRGERPRVVFMSSPNNPTGNCLGAEGMLKVIEAAPGIVVVDEAYQPYAGGRGFLPMLKDYPNLVVMRTLSKVGLAGLRVGFMIAGEDIIAEVNKVRLPFNLNSVSQALALSALKDRALMKRSIGAVVKERGRLAREMAGVKGIRVYPSEANFLLFRADDAGALHAGLLKRGVLVRNLNGIIDGCLRVTVGTRGENDAFLGALRAALEKGAKAGK